MTRPSPAVTLHTMKKLAAILLAATALLAAEQSHQGTVKSLTAKQLVIETGSGERAFVVSDKTALDKNAVKQGVRVAVAVLEDGKTAKSVTVAAEAGPRAVLVASDKVCMINDRAMAMDQIPVEIDGKTYYGCCPMCKERLVKDETSRYAVDPVTGKKVDKAKAVIGALPGAAVLYFESAENLARYNAGARAENVK